VAVKTAAVNCFLPSRGGGGGGKAEIDYACQVEFFAEVFHHRCRKITKKYRDNRNRANKREYEKQNFRATKCVVSIYKIINIVPC
jgi:hypothetical protein